jgi:hypothetical protein
MSNPWMLYKNKESSYGKNKVVIEMNNRLKIFLILFRVLNSASEYAQFLMVTQCPLMRQLAECIRF